MNASDPIVWLGGAHKDSGRVIEFAYDLNFLLRCKYGIHVRCTTVGISDRALFRCVAIDDPHDSELIYGVPLDQLKEPRGLALFGTVEKHAANVARQMKAKR